ncbi:MAG: PQQ-dependent sugar dehydrogenase [Candidatus Rokubacteria bacterium]|nr:PQQ-dependent sugar dehydrogenase [Candidatus Rokubacteria bacterium]
MATSPLAPIPLPPTPTPASQIPVGKIKLPPGFTISVWADGLHNARQMAWGARGTLFVGTRVVNQVYAVVDRGGRREVKVIAKGLSQPSGVAFKDGALYVAEIPRILKYENIEANLDNPPAPKVVYEFPQGAHHNWRFLMFGPDGKLYFNMGAPCNICMPPDTHANVSRVNPDGTGFEYVAFGVRNSTGGDFHPVTKEIYFVSHGRDWAGDDFPNDTLHHAPRKGLHFGFPYCHQGDTVDPDFGKGRSCSEFAPPLLKLGPHVAPIGTRFYSGTLFPPQYQNRLFIAQKGSWNRTVKNGYRVMTVELKPGQPPKYEVFADGFHEGDKVLGRPTHIEWMPDGSMLLSDDFHGAIYHITYKR